MTAGNASPRNSEPAASRPYMPGYGIADAHSGRGLLPWSWAEQFLDQARRYWLATTRADGAPHVMPIWGIWFDGAFCFMTGPQSRKARNLASNPHCVVCPERADEVLILEGTVEVVSEPSFIQRFKDLCQQKYNFDMGPYNDPVFKVRPLVVFGHIEDIPNKGFTQTATRWTFGNS